MYSNFSQMNPDTWMIFYSDQSFLLQESAMQNKPCTTALVYVQADQRDRIQNKFSTEEILHLLVCK